MKNKALQNTKSAQTMNNATPSGLDKIPFSNKDKNPLYKALINRSYNAVKVEFLRRTGFRLTQQNIWALALLRMYFYTSNKTPVLHPSYRQMSHKEIITQLPHTPVGKAIIEGAFNDDGSLSSTYKRIVRINTYRSRTVGIKKADDPKKAEGVMFEVFQPDQRTPEEKASGAIVHSANIIRLTGWAKQIVDEAIGDPKLSAWFWGRNEKTDESDESSKKRERKLHKRNSRHGEEPKWVEEEYRKQTDPVLPDPEPDEVLPWPPEIKEAHQRQIERQIAEGIEARRRSALELIEAFRRGVAQGGVAVEKPEENRGIEEETRTKSGPLPSVGILDPLHTYLRPPPPPSPGSNSFSPEIKTADKDKLVAIVGPIEQFPNPIPISTAEKSNVSLDTLSGSQEIIPNLSLLQQQNSDNKPIVPTLQPINNSKTIPISPNDGTHQPATTTQQKSDPARSLPSQKKPIDELNQLIAFIASYGIISGPWVEALKRQLGPNPPPPSPDVPFYPPHLNVSGIPRVVPKRNPYQPRGHPEEECQGWNSPGHRRKDNGDGFP